MKLLHVVILTQMGMEKLIALHLYLGEVMVFMLGLNQDRMLLLLDKLPIPTL